MRTGVQRNFRTVLFIVLSVMIAGLSVSVLANESAGAPRAGSEKAVDIDPIEIAKRCFVDESNNACDQYVHGSDPCPDTIIYGDACSSVSSAAEGFSTATGYTAICKVRIGTPNEQGECVYTTEQVTMDCKRAEGAACPTSTETTN